MISKNDLAGRNFIGKVVDNNDPEKEGRARIKIFGLFDDIPDDQLPWAFPGGRKMFVGGDGGFADISIPKIGSFVQVKFNEGDLYSIEYSSIQNINTAVRNEIAETYLNSHVLAYDEDEDLKIFYTPGKGLQIYLKKSKVQINPDSSITIEHADTSSIIELVGPQINITANSAINITANSIIKGESAEVSMNGSSVTKLGPAPTYSAVLAEPLFAFLKALASGVDSKLPATPGIFSSQAASFETLATSKNVKVSP